ncbi:hypothetical protein HHI36_020732, partial [Cryptolaemus montrouzieri]
MEMFGNQMNIFESDRWNTEESYEASLMYVLETRFLFGIWPPENGGDLGVDRVVGNGKLGFI